MFIKSICFRITAVVVVCCVLRISVKVWTNWGSKLQSQAVLNERIPNDGQQSENRNIIYGSSEEPESSETSTASWLDSQQLEQKRENIVDKGMKFREPQVKLKEGATFGTPVPYGQLKDATMKPFNPSPAEVTGKQQYPANFTAVAIVTYMRSGSSFTGDILQRHPDAFYVFEPLRNLQEQHKTNSSLIYQNGDVVNYPFDFLAVGTQLIEGWLSCNFDLIYMDAFEDIFLKNGRKTKIMPKCLSSHSVRHCIKTLQQLCLSSRVRIVKTIRMPMSFLSGLFEIIPNFKILHLVRDPRATLFSQAKRQKCGWRYGGIQGCSNTLCTRVEGDILFEKSVRAKFPSRIQTVHYEQIARKPIPAAKSLYEFVGMEFLDSITKYVLNITSGGKDSRCVTCTNKSNSTAHIDAWKNRINPALLKTIEYRCSFVMETYNYPAVL